MSYVQPMPIVLVDPTGAPYAINGVVDASRKYAQPVPAVLVDLTGVPHHA